VEVRILRQEGQSITGIIQELLLELFYHSKIVEQSNCDPPPGSQKFTDLTRFSLAREVRVGVKDFSSNIPSAPFRAAFGYNTAR
jgi:hypothetical protein